MALHLFNTASGRFPSASAFLTYTLAMSPRHDLLAVIRRDAIPNLAGRLLPHPDGGGRVSGLRVVGLEPLRLYDLVHVPTGARLVITDRERFPRTAHGTIPEQVFGPRGPGLDVPLSESERQVADIIDALPDPMLRLLAGLTVRVCSVHPDGLWSLGYWSVEWSELSGAENSWEMRWQRHPDPREVADALTDPVFGIAGARSLPGLDGRSIDVMVDGARLRLRQVGRRGE